MFGGRHLPFSGEAFLSLVESYNAAIWPLQIVAYTLGVVVFILVFLRVGQGGRAAGAILAAFWLWTGVVFHWQFFAEINFIAPVFALLFVIQGLLLVWRPVARGGMTLAFTNDLPGWTGIALMAIALGVLPLLGPVLGRPWAQSEMFGVTPGSVAVFTLGLLLLARPGTPLSLAIIPLLWTLIAGIGAVLLGMHENLVLPAAGMLALGAIAVKARQTS